MHTTNYKNTFIQIADDSPIQTAEVPPLKGKDKSVANLQFEMVLDHPYRFTSDEVIFHVFATKNEVSSAERTDAFEKFFSKGQPCMRCSPLTKRYGWGVHSDAEGRVAIYPAGSQEYERFAADPALKQIKAMRSSRA